MVDVRGCGGGGAPEDLCVIDYVDPSGREPKEGDGRGEQHPKLERP